MIIDHFSTFPHGGAGTAARRLHQRLLDKDVTSRFNFWKDESSQRLDKSYRKLDFQRRVPYPWFTTISKKIERHRRRQICRQYDTHLATRPENFELFSIPWSLEKSHVNFEELGSDVVHLHWMAFFIDYPSFFGSIPDSKPIVWSFHDMNPLTGGCHYSSGCSRFTVGCGSCPQISNSHPRDVSFTGFRDKQRALKNKSLTIVTPNLWLSELAQHSRVFPESTQYRVIPLGLDEDQFRPIEKRQARKELGLDLDKNFIAFGAEDIQNYRKGFHHLLAALKKVGQQRDVQCLVFGSGQLPDDRGGLPPMHEFGFVDSNQKQQLIYSAADLFVLPSREDNQPQTGLESMACGTPVVGFRAGGIPEYVIPGKTGLLATMGDENDMAGCITQLLVDDKLAQQLAYQAREMIVARFTAEQQASAYINMYSEILAGHSSATRGSELSRAA